MTSGHDGRTATEEPLQERKVARKSGKLRFASRFSV
jgi:hypothetical protein